MSEAVATRRYNLEATELMRIFGAIIEKIKNNNP
jgi:hypothetical protein